VKDQISHPYKTTGQIKFFYNLIFRFLSRTQEDKTFWTEAFHKCNLLLRRVAANILNQQSWTANKGWHSSLGVAHGA